METGTDFLKFSVNSRTIDRKSGKLKTVPMGLQPIHLFLNKLLHQ